MPPSKLFDSVINVRGINVNFKIAALISGLLVVMSALTAAATSDDEIRDRLQPAGSVCLIGDSCAGASAVASSPSGTRDAASIYQTFCVACHATGVSESPILGNAEQWEARVAKGTDALYASSINGLNVMPPRGTCVDCSDDEMRAVVDYMLDAL